MTNPNPKWTHKHSGKEALSFPLYNVLDSDGDVVVEDTTYNIASTITEGVNRCHTMSNLTDREVGALAKYDLRKVTELLDKLINNDVQMEPMFTIDYGHERYLRGRIDGMKVWVQRARDCLA